MLPIKSVLLDKIVTNKLAVRNTTDTLFKNKIFHDVFLIEDMEYAVLWQEKKVLIAPFVERLGKPY